MRVHYTIKMVHLTWINVHIPAVIHIFLFDKLQMCSTTRRVCTRRPGVMPHFAFPKNKLTKIHLNSFLWCHHHKNICQKVTVCQILNLNKIVHHKWFVIQWYVDSEEACCPVPHTPNSKIANHIWIIHLRLSIWRPGAQMLVDMARCHAPCPKYWDVDHKVLGHWP